MSNPITQRGFVTIQSLLVTKHMMFKMPYIHYIDVKVMNNVSRKSLDWHPYYTAGHPCSLACLIMICSLLDVKLKEHNWRNGFFHYSGLELQPQSAVKILNMQTTCSSIFGRKITKGLLSTMCWSGRLCSCAWSLLSTEMLPLEWSDADADWRGLPSPQQLIYWEFTI